MNSSVSEICWLFERESDSGPFVSVTRPLKPYVLYTDASDTCIGAVLTQQVEDENGKEAEKPFHKLSDTQRSWSIIEKEADAIHYSLQKWDHDLHGADFVGRTDHNPLKYLLESPMQNRKVLTLAL